jgi:hypothetical protein
MSGVNISNITLQVKDCGKVQIENIKSGDQQKLNVELENMDKFTIEKQTIEEAMTVRTT